MPPTPSPAGPIDLSPSSTRDQLVNRASVLGMGLVLVVPGHPGSSFLMPAIDGTTTLPAQVGGATVHNAVELAQNLANSPTFINCFAKSMLQYGVSELSASVDLPLPPSQSGCAAADVVSRYQSGSAQTFTGLLTAVTQSPAFAVRQAAP